MSTYNPSIPQPTHLISVSQGQILDNFSQLNTQFAVDHTAFWTGSSNGDGFHKKMTLPTVQVADPAPAGTAAELYTKAVSGVAQMFFANASGVNQLTGANVIGSTGYITIAGGIVLKWGSLGGKNNGDVITFPAAFANNLFSINITLFSGLPNAIVGVSNTSKTGFTFHTNQAGTAFFYIAIGN